MSRPQSFLFFSFYGDEWQSDGSPCQLRVKAVFPAGLNFLHFERKEACGNVMMYVCQ